VRCHRRRSLRGGFATARPPGWSPPRGAGPGARAEPARDSGRRGAGGHTGRVGRRRGAGPSARPSTRTTLGWIRRRSTCPVRAARRRVRCRGRSPAARTCTASGRSCGARPAACAAKRRRRGDPAQRGGLDLVVLGARCPTGVRDQEPGVVATWWPHRGDPPRPHRQRVEVEDELVLVRARGASRPRRAPASGRGSQPPPRRAPRRHERRPSGPDGEQDPGLLEGLAHRGDEQGSPPPRRGCTERQRRHPDRRPGVHPGVAEDLTEQLRGAVGDQVLLGEPSVDATNTVSLTTRTRIEVADPPAAARATASTLSAGVRASPRPPRW
jgi:hypothetical protein